MSNSHRRKDDAKVDDKIAARKGQKADRERERRDKLNAQFQELQDILDPDNPKNDKASLLSDTIQVLKDLHYEINTLKTEYELLSKESQELTEEKNDLRKEKSSLESDIENLKGRYQQGVQFMTPWTTVTPQIIMAQPFPFPVMFPVPPVPSPMHPTIQSPTFLGNHHVLSTNACSPFIPYMSLLTQPLDQPSTLDVASSYVYSQQDSKSRSYEQDASTSGEKVDDSDYVTIDLELKMPVSKVQRESLPSKRKGKQPMTDGSCSTKGLSPQDFQGSFSNK